VNEALLVSNALLLWVAVLVLAARSGRTGAPDRRAPRTRRAGRRALARVGREGRRRGARPRRDRPRRGSARVGEVAADGRDTLLFFLSPSCPVCKALLPALGSLANAEAGRLRVLFASDGPRAEHEAFVAREKLTFPYLLSAQLGIAYRVGKLPWAVLIDAAGVVRASVS